MNRFFAKMALAVGIVLVASTVAFACETHATIPDNGQFAFIFCDANAITPGQVDVVFVGSASGSGTTRVADDNGDLTGGPVFHALYVTVGNDTFAASPSHPVDVNLGAENGRFEDSKGNPLDFTTHPHGGTWVNTTTVEAGVAGAGVVTREC